MKFETGKLYRTKDGKQARIFAIEPSQEWPILGAYCSDGTWFAHQWRPDGSASPDPRYQSPLAIVGEWIEPETEMFVGKVTSSNGQTTYVWGNTPESVRQAVDELIKKFPHTSWGYEMFRALKVDPDSYPEK